MPSEVRSFAVSVPAGTPASAPQITPLAMPARIVREIRVRVPPGPRGEVGWALGAAGVPVLPWNAGAWIVADDESIDWPVAGQIESGAWELRAYNTGAFAHTIYVTFLLDVVAAAIVGSSVSAPLSPAAIAGVS